MTLLKLTVVNIADRDMIAPTVTKASAELLAPQRKDCRDNIQRLGEHGRSREITWALTAAITRQPICWLRSRFMCRYIFR